MTTARERAEAKALDAWCAEIEAGGDSELAMVAALAAADAQMESAGWVRVPVEPTADMVEAPFVGTIEQQDFVMQTKKRKAMAANYRAMIAARPTAKG